MFYNCNNKACGGLSGLLASGPVCSRALCYSHFRVCHLQNYAVLPGRWKIPENTSILGLMSPRWRMTVSCKCANHTWYIGPETYVEVEELSHLLSVFLYSGLTQTIFFAEYILLWYPHSPPLCVHVAFHIFMPHLFRALWNTGFRSKKRFPTICLTSPQMELLSLPKKTSRQSLTKVWFICKRQKPFESILSVAAMVVLKINLGIKPPWKGHRFYRLGDIKIGLWCLET